VVGRALLALALVLGATAGRATASDASASIVLETAPHGIEAPSERARDLLLRQLASDAAWRVVRIGATAASPGTLAAIKRDYVGEQLPSEERILADAAPLPPWRWTRNGFVSRLDGSQARQTRVLIRFGAATDRFWSDPRLASTAALDAARIEVDVFRSAGDVPLLESYLVLEGGGIGIEIFEAHADLRRGFTAAAIAETRALIRTVQARADGGAGGLDRSRKTPGSIVPGERPAMRIEAAGLPGRFAVGGHANPGQPGWLYVKVLDAVSGASLQSAAEERDTSEYAGWSDDSREQFYFNGLAQCRASGGPAAVTARFELRFVADDGGERLLLAVEQPVTCAGD
jgi:hypothetical protein